MTVAVPFLPQKKTKKTIKPDEKKRGDENGSRRFF